MTNPTHPKPITLVTGAGGALGQAVCEELLSHGHAIVMVDRPPAQSRLEARAEALGEAASVACFDEADLDAWALALSGIESTTGRLTGAVLVAGAWAGGAPLHEEHEGTWRKMMDSNLETAHTAMRATLPGMIAAGAGSIVLIGSRAALRPEQSAKAPAYAVSKAAVVALAQAAAADAIMHGVRINVVLPATMDTPGNRAAMPKADRSGWVETRSVAGVVAFLLSDAARDVSGAAIPIYGKG